MANSPDIEGLKLPELKAMGEALGIPKARYMRKPELLEAIAGLGTPDTGAPTPAAAASAASAPEGDAPVRDERRRGRPPRQPEASSDASAVSATLSEGDGQRERSERGPRPERGERGERQDRGERQERGDRQDRGERGPSKGFRITLDPNVLVGTVRILSTLTLSYKGQSDPDTRGRYSFRQRDHNFLTSICHERLRLMAGTRSKRRMWDRCSVVPETLNWAKQSSISEVQDG